MLVPCEALARRTGKRKGYCATIKLILMLLEKKKSTSQQKEKEFSECSVTNQPSSYAGPPE